ncbi:hypothetical protein HYW74_02215, partial [Candidatus Pacearchaeota archaeon]|nr:hypothetical protein [Candidatus Pacearchaeota archaeon]
TYNLTNWKATGRDTNSFFANPLLTDINGPDGIFSEGAGLDANLRLLIGSPAIGAGANLGALLYYDIERKIRGSLIDIGAYEYTSSVGCNNNGIKETDEQCDLLDFGTSYNGLCTNYSATLYTSGSLICSSCQINVSSCISSLPAVCGSNGCESALGETCSSCPADCGVCGGGGGGDNGGSDDEPVIQYNNVNLAISGVVMKNDAQGTKCDTCDVTITLQSYANNTQTNANGEFTATFNTINFSSGFNKININVVKTSEGINKNYVKEMFIKSI